MTIFSRAIVLSLILAVAVACGTAARPVFEPTEETPDPVQEQNVDGVEVASVPTETPIPPTATPTEEPTATSEPPTATPTEEPTEAPADPLTRLIASRDPADGEALFNQTFSETGFACATCHYVDQEGTLIGPSLLNIKDIAGTRVDGLSAERYLYNSIVNTNDYIVDGFVENVMPQNWSEVLSDTDVYDIIAYIMTLEG